MIAVLPVIPSDAIDVVAAAITEPVAPMGPAPGCIFPLRFRGQTQDGDRERGLTRQLPTKHSFTTLSLAQRAAEIVRAKYPNQQIFMCRLGNLNSLAGESFH